MFWVVIQLTDRLGRKVRSVYLFNCKSVALLLVPSVIYNGVVEQTPDVYYNTGMLWWLTGEVNGTTIWRAYQWRPSALTTQTLTISDFYRLQFILDEYSSGSTPFPQIRTPNNPQRLGSVLANSDGLTGDVGFSLTWSENPKILILRVYWFDGNFHIKVTLTVEMTGKHKSFT